MSQQHISTTEHKPVVRVSTEAVKKAIEKFVDQRTEKHFTTADIARFMEVDEYPVRAAFSWLARYGLIEIIPGVRSKRYLEQPADRRLHGDSYSVSMYRVKERAAEVDFAALNRAFGYGC